MTITPQTNPLEIFSAWMSEAKQTPAILEPTAMTIATANSQGDVHARIVLCKGWSETGFTFFTNYQSQKGLDLSASPRAAAVFFWDPLRRQVKISGQVARVSRADSEAYWRSRPRDSQLSQFISKQSQPVNSREQMQKEWVQADEAFKNRDIPCPDHWGGYELTPTHIEFWMSQPGRLHDRFLYEKSVSGWTFTRLYP